MLRTIAIASLIIWPTLGPGQDLIIGDARIVTGSGSTIDRGSIVVRGGRIESVMAGDVQGPGATLNAGGLTALPGFIDTHRHLFSFKFRDWFSESAELVVDLHEEIERDVVPVLAEMLENGLTTFLSTGDLAPEIFEIRQRIADGEILGPRMLAVGKQFTAPDDWPIRLCLGSPECRSRYVIEVTDPRVARARVREQADANPDGIKVVYDRLNAPAVTVSDAVLGAIIDEAGQLGLFAMIHAETVDDMLRVVDLGGRRLVHTPIVGDIAEGPGAEILRDAGVAISTTVSFSSAQFAEAAGIVYDRKDEHERLLQNIRHLWDEGVVVAFGTDNPRRLGTAQFMVEVYELARVLSPEEIVFALTRNGAIFLGLEDEIGTLAPGKIADIVFVEGDPLTDVSSLENVRVVVQGGKVVVDNR